MLQNLRYAALALWRDRAFAVLSTLLLSLTIGATLAVYAVVDAVVLSPFAFERQDRTVVIWETDRQRHSPVVEVALGEVDAWRRHTRSFESLAVFGSVNWDITLVDGDARARAPYAAVSSSFFQVVGTVPMLGRVLEANDDLGAVTRTAVISHDLWMRRYGGDARAVGRILSVQREPEAPVESIEIVGVMPAGFDYPRGAELWLPAGPEVRTAVRGSLYEEDWAVAHLKVFYALGRLHDASTAATAQQELTSAIGQLEGRSGSTDRSPEAVVIPVDAHLLGPARPVLWTVLAGALLMLVIACTNIAGLHVFRAARHERALAIRLALGASRARLVSQTICESMLLAGVALCGAALVAWVCSRGLVLASPADVPRLSMVTLATPGVFVMAVALTAVTILLCCLWPAIFTGRLDAAGILAHGARSAAHPRERRLQQVLVVSQVAIAVVLLVGTMLFARSVRQLDRTALGFDPTNLLAMEIEPATSSQERWDSFYGALLERTGALPLVTSAGAVYLRPLSGPIGNDVIPVLRGQQPAEWSANPRANLETVTPGYFRTMGTRLVAGRYFTSEDRPGGPGAIIVSESAAARYWPGQNPVGQVLVLPAQRVPGTREEPRWQTVVGVVEDMRYRGLTDPRLDVYLPAAQSTNRVKDLIVRTSGDLLLAAAAVRSLALELDPHAQVGSVTTLEAEVTGESAPWRFAMRVLGVFGALAAALATLGLVASISLVVALRTRELGIRAALGASPGRLPGGRVARGRADRRGRRSRRHRGRPGVRAGRGWPARGREPSRSPGHCGSRGRRDGRCRHRLSPARGPRIRSRSGRCPSKRVAQRGQEMGTVQMLAWPQELRALRAMHDAEGFRDEISSSPGGELARHGHRAVLNTNPIERSTGLNGVP